MLKSHYPSVTKLLIEMDSIINLHINTNQPKGSEHVYLKILGKKKSWKKEREKFHEKKAVYLVFPSSIVLFLIWIPLK